MFTKLPGAVNKVPHSMPRSQHTSGRSSRHQEHPRTGMRTQLPVKQIFILALLLLTEPLTNSIIRSFTDASTSLANPNQSLADEDVPEVSLYSQLLESSLFLAKAATAYQWGSLSDKLGRRPILLLGPLGLSLSTSVLGASNNPCIQTAARVMQGIFGGSIETTKTVIAEVTNSTNRHRAYTTLPLVQSVGVSIGSSLGNLLATLDTRLPKLEEIQFLKDHPLFIPCAISAAFTLTTFHFTHRGFKETLPAEFRVDWKVLWKFRDRAKSVAPSIPRSSAALLNEARGIGYGAIHQIEDAVGGAITSARREATQAAVRLLPADRVNSVREGLRLRRLLSLQLVIALLNYAFISFLDQVQQILLPSMYTAPIEQYGLGLSPDETAEVMAKWGSYNNLLQLMLFPWLLKELGPKRAYALCLSSMLVFFALFPVLHLAAKYLDGDAQPAFRNLLTIHAGTSSFVYMAYGCSQLLIMDVVPDPASIGSVNGIGQSVGSSARMIAPPVISFLRALSLKDKKFGGYLVYVVLLCITKLGIIISVLLSRH